MADLIQNPPADNAPLPAFAVRVAAWQAHCGRRGLPWMTPDPYRRWVSEIMLQQTQVPVVVDYFERFMRALPDVAALARADESLVLGLWSGLGYYSRARNLLAASRMIMGGLGGRFPTTLQGWMALPGVGRSTAAAVVSFCWGVPEPVVDGNVVRLLARHTAWTGPVDDAAGRRRMLEEARVRITEGAARGVEAGVYNQGMMDLGATVCVRHHPACGACPVAGDCQGLARGLQLAIPRPRARPDRKPRRLALLWMVSDLGVLMVRRPAGDIWQGLWCLPEAGAAADGRRPVMRLKRTLTHLDLTIDVYAAGGQPAAVPDGCFWLAPERVAGAPLPEPIAAVLARMGGKSGAQ